MDALTRSVAFKIEIKTVSGYSTAPFVAVCANSSLSSSKLQTAANQIPCRGSEAKERAAALAWACHAIAYAIDPSTWPTFLGPASIATVRQHICQLYPISSAKPGADT